MKFEYTFILLKLFYFIRSIFLKIQAILDIYLIKEISNALPKKSLE